VSKLTTQLDAFAARHITGKSKVIHHYGLEKLTDIYLHSDRENQVGKTGNISTLYIFSAIAIFIILIASVNFINLSTARAAERAKEVAIKKVNGVSRQQLLVQFFIESFLMTFIALVIAVLLSSVLLPAFDQFSGRELHFDLFTPTHVIAFFILIGTIGLLSGSYPAFVLSAFKPISALKGNLKSSAWSVGVRKGLVVFQFVVSVVLIVSTIVVYHQLKFMQQHELGFNRSQTLVLNFEGDTTVQHQYKYIKTALLKMPGVKSVTASSNTPGDLQPGGWSMDFAKKTGDTVHTEMPIYLTDFDFLTQYHITIVAGRAFSPEYPADATESMLINETALHKLGFNNAEEAIGVKVGTYPTDGKIIGIFKDFHFEGLQKAIQPLAMRVLPNKFSVFSLELNTHNVQQTVAAIATLWKTVAPQRPLEYSFLDESFNRQYQAETKFGQLFALFTTLAIGIACFGLFGLALFSVKQRTKEIGIRKVVGASVAQIAALLSKDFITLVLIAICIGSPIAWYVMDKWIKGFAYRIHISWWIFILGGTIAVTIALFTIVYQALKAAIVNPVKSLRSE
jgi:putative ABC transport system permease protein